MRTIYLKDTTKPILGTGNQYHYKVTQISETECNTVTVTKNSIEVENDDEYYHQVDFIKNTLCEGMYKVITKMEFDSFYVKTVHAINDAMNLEIEVKALEDEMEEFNKGLRNILSS